MKTAVLIKPIPQAVRPNALEIERFSLAYRGRYAFREVSFQVPERSITALIGPSGCGKTSLLMGLNRLSDLVPGCTVEGQVRYRGADIRAHNTNVTQLRRRIGMIFQKPNPFPLSVRRNLELPLLEIGMSARAEREETIERVLREVGLWEEAKDRLDSAAQVLSGGQQQRLCIARALVLKPDVLLMDEPCSALDPLASSVVEDLIRSLKTEYTVVIVTHNLAQARRISDHCAVFWTRDGAGRLVECGDTGCVFECPTDPVTAAYVQGRQG